MLVKGAIGMLYKGERIAPSGILQDDMKPFMGENIFM